MKNPADAPDHALVDHAIGDAEPIPEFEGTLGKTDRTRPFADPIGIVEQNHGLAALRQINRERQADRAGPDHHHGVFGRVGCGAILVGMASIAELDFGLLRHAFTLLWGKDLIGKNFNSKNFGPVTSLW
jgi:hypothetical protein